MSKTSLWVCTWRLHLSDLLPQWRHTLRHIHTPPAAAMMVGAFLSYSLHPYYLHLQSSDASSNNEHLSSLRSGRSFWSFSVSPQQEGLDDGPDFLSEEDRGVSFFSFLISVLSLCSCCVLCMFAVCVCSQRTCVLLLGSLWPSVCVCVLFESVCSLPPDKPHTHKPLYAQWFALDSPVWWQYQKLEQEPTTHIMPLTMSSSSWLNYLVKVKE